jgi:hypothetical protein
MLQHVSWFVSQMKRTELYKFLQIVLQQQPQRNISPDTRNVDAEVRNRLALTVGLVAAVNTTSIRYNDVTIAGTVINLTIEMLMTEATILLPFK